MVRRATCLLLLGFLALTSRDRLGPVAVPAGPEQRLGTRPGATLEFPDAPSAVLPSGTVMTIWQRALHPDQSTTSIEVLVRTFSASGAPLGEERRVAGDDEKGASQPAITPLDGRSFLAVWRKTSGDGAPAVEGIVLDERGAPRTPILQLSAETASQPRSPRVARDGSAGFVAAWEDRRLDDESWGVFVRRFSVSGKALGEAAQVEDATGGDQHLEGLAGSPEGGFLVLWSHFATGRAQRRDLLALQFGADGKELGPARSMVQVAGVSGAAATWMEGQRFAVVSTTEVVAQEAAQKSESSAVTLRFLDRGNPGAIVPVHPPGSGTVDHPAIASNARGDLLVAWRNQPAGIFGRFYDLESGLPLDSATLLTSRRDSFHPALSAAPDGGFVLTWWSAGDFLRRLGPPTRASHPLSKSAVSCQERAAALRLGRLRGERGAESQDVPVVQVIPGAAGRYEAATYYVPRADLQTAERRDVPAPGPSASPRRRFLIEPSNGGELPFVENSPAGAVGPALVSAAPQDLYSGLWVSPALATAPSAGPGLRCSDEPTERDRRFLAAISQRITVVGAARTFLVVLYRGEGIQTFRIDIYPLDAQGAPLGRLAAVVHLDLLDDEGPRSGSLTRLHDCRPGEESACTRLTVPVELRLASPLTVSPAVSSDRWVAIRSGSRSIPSQDEVGRRADFVWR